MKFAVDTKVMIEALESIQGKGKYLTSSGFTNNSMGLNFLMKLSGNTLSIWNGDTTFAMNINLEVIGAEDGEFIGNCKTIVPYLKKYGELTSFVVEDYLTVGSGTKKASIARVINHPNMDALIRLQAMLAHINHEEELTELPKFGKSEYEGAFILNQKVFSDCISSCELANHGAFKLDYNGEVVVFSSGLNIQNQYEETITPSSCFGEEATLEYSGPLHKFFKNNSDITFYVKDEFPLLLVAEDRMIIKAPFSAGN